MGVDYDAIFGLGVELDFDSIKSIFPNEEDLLNEKLDSYLSNGDFEVISYGDEYYGGSDNYCLVLRNPDWDNIPSQKNLLFNYLDKHKILYSKFSLVGGLKMS